MKLNINAELELQEVIDSYFRPKLEAQGIKDGIYKIMVQNKAGDFVELAPEKVKLVFNNKHE